jgi:hypothetical protein
MDDEEIVKVFAHFLKLLVQGESPETNEPVTIILGGNPVTVEAEKKGD